MTTSHPASSGRVYAFHYDSPLEMARMTEQIWLFTKTMGCALGKLPAPSLMHHVLDVSCGPGDWVLDVAFAYPHLEVEGIDVNRTVIDYANAKARSQSLDNVSFGVMDFLEPLDFSDHTFDIIHGSYLSMRIPREAWPVFLRECLRVLKPGGILTLLDSDEILTNSPVCNNITSLFSEAMRVAGYGFSPDGKSMGITPVLPSLFRKAGFQEVTLDAYAIDFSAGSPDWLTVTRGLEVVSQILIEMFTTMQVPLPSLLEDEYKRGRIEMLSDDFCGLWPLLNIWATKPLDA